MTPTALLRETFRLNALRIVQRRDVPLYVFAINGRLLHRLAAVDPARRDQEGALVGYQRNRVERHIREIQSYLMQADSILPNAIVISFENSVDFTVTPGTLASEWGTPGILKLSLPLPGERKPAIVIDGQQRMSAFADIPPGKNMPVVVVGFSSPSESMEREQFVLVNKTKPLPRDLLNELLPHVNTTMPPAWRVRAIAGSVVERLRFDPDSPFYERVRGIGSAGEGANISQAALLDVIEHSIRRGGVLTQYFSSERGQTDIQSMTQVVKTFYLGVAKTWPSAWNMSPRSSRLVHGVGLVALGRVMDVLMSDIDVSSRLATSTVSRRLKKLDRKVAWTKGRWPGLHCAWNELQNTSQDKRRLANHLLAQFQR